MVYRIATTRTRLLARARAWLTASMSGRTFGLALACLLLSGLAPTAAATPPASEQKLAAKDKPAKPAKPQGTDTDTRPAPAGKIASGPAVLQRRRLAIAQMVERSIVYRTLFDVKLLNAKLAGPFEKTVRNSLFSRETHTVTLYCASAEFDVPWIHPLRKYALIQVSSSSNGLERLHASIPYNYGVPFGCDHANYAPFPELELARAKRRKALGKAD